MESPLRLLPLECTQAHSHHEQNKIQTVTVNLTQCDCLYPCPFHITSLFHGLIRRRKCSGITNTAIGQTASLSAYLKDSSRILLSIRLNVGGTLHLPAVFVYFTLERELSY